MRACEKTKSYTILTLTVVQKMLIGQISFQSVVGPIPIVKDAGNKAKTELTYFLFFMGFVRISFGVLNLLPFPVLDAVICFITYTKHFLATHIQKR